MPSTLYWIDHINYLTARLLAIITEKQWTASGPFPDVSMSNTHLALVGTPNRCGACILKQGHVRGMVQNSLSALLTV